MNNAEMFVFYFLSIILIGTIFSLFYTLAYRSEEKVFKYLRHISLYISIVSFGFCTIIAIIFLIVLMTKITITLLGY